ncbi:MAG: autotransporter outer membrane beta-barrel domain-containing protein, partial [Betaproteobacteria bacterium]|nr:autotransporter outer membrane beta-barrel domain-containing protein [Betaproteobacteria bacterium]
GGSGGSGGGVGGGSGSGGSGGGVGGGSDGSGSDPIRNIVTNISAGALTAYQTGALSISDRVVVGLDQRSRFPQADEAWQTWADIRHTGISDNRNGIDASGHANSVLIGVHRAFGKDLVAGLAAATSKTRLGAFDSTVRNDGDGVFVGPYAGYRLSANWLLDGWAGWGRTDNDTQLAVLSGDFRTTTGFASANLTGGYAFGDYLFRPKLALFYSHSSSDAFNYTGTLPYAGQIYNVTLRVNENSFDYATSELSGDISRAFTTAGGSRIIPALRLGVRYDIERPNDGKILNGNLDLESTSPWSGSVRMALAIEPQRNLRLELVTGYYSIGRQDVDLWDVRLNAAVSF